MVRGTFDYLKKLDLYATEKPYEILVPMSLFPDANIPKTNLAFETVEVEIKDVRGREDHYSLDNNGFAFTKHDAPTIDFSDREAIEQEHISGVQQLLRRQIPGIKRLFSFDWRVRKSISPDEFSKRTIDLEDGLDALLPAVHPHVDQSKGAAIQRVKMHMGDDADELLRGRVRIINVWQPLSCVSSWPLALCDSQSVIKGDLVDSDIIRRRYVGETSFGAYNSKHRWHYLSNQTPEEATMIKIFDSSPTATATRCMHASFQDSAGSPDQLRESIEVRTLVFSDY
ncbi:hypothetical protein BX600DRAFT_474476 [Xylariales sp. PMI_506]|nr:hypothetical protein BX600DRAFT_474476 [Xylariales sp. PMI_506]